MGKRRCTSSEKGGRLLRKRWATKSFRFTVVGDIVLDAPRASISLFRFTAVGEVVLDALRASISLLGL